MLESRVARWKIMCSLLCKLVLGTTLLCTCNSTGVHEPCLCPFRNISRSTVPIFHGTKGRDMVHFPETSCQNIKVTSITEQTQKRGIPLLKYEEKTHLNRDACFEHFICVLKNPRIVSVATPNPSRILIDMPDNIVLNVVRRPPTTNCFYRALLNSWGIFLPKKAWNSSLKYLFLQNSKWKCLESKERNAERQNGEWRETQRRKEKEHEGDGSVFILSCCTTVLSVL